MQGNRGCYFSLPSHARKWLLAYRGEIRGNEKMEKGREITAKQQGTCFCMKVDRCPLNDTCRHQGL